LVGIVIIEAELGLAAMLAVYVAATASFVGGACTLAFGGDARSGNTAPQKNNIISFFIASPWPSPRGLFLRGEAQLSLSQLNVE